VLLKKGLSSFGNLQFNSFFSKILTILFQPVIILALSCYIVGMIAYIFLLSRLELTYVYPICTSLIFGGITFLGWLILNEALSWPKLLGIIFIIIGIFLIERFG